MIPSIRVEDVSRAVQFYRDRLGFELLRGGDVAENNALRRGDAQIMVEGASAYYSAGYNEAIVRRLGSHSPTALYVEAEDLTDLYARVRAAGVSIVDPLAERPWGQSEFTVEDPDGNWLTFWKAVG